MNVLHDSIESLKNNPQLPSFLSTVLKSVLKGTPVEGEGEADLVTLIHELLAKKSSIYKVREVFTELGLDSQTVESVCESWDSLPEIRAGVVFPKLVDVNWDTSHLIYTTEGGPHPQN